MKTESQKILVITPFFSPNVGGVETHLDDLCNYFTNRKKIVSIITYQPLISKRKVSSFEKNGTVTIRRISWLGNGLFNKFEPYPLFEVLYLFPALYLRTLFFCLSDRKDVDVIVTHGLVASLVGKFIKPVLRKPAVATVHTIYYLDTKPLVGRVFGWILQSYDKVLFASEKIRQEFVNFGVDRRKAVVFTYWADNSRFKPLVKRDAKKIVGWEDKFVVLFVGRLIKEKGADLLVEVARMANKNVFFAFVTSGSYAEFKKLIGGRVPSNVIFVGQVDYSRLHLYYNAADIFVLSSPHREGFSRAVLEAALCGTPVIASNVGCLPEVVDSRIGRLVDPTPSNFLEVINYFYNHQDELLKISRTCAEYAQNHFTDSNAKLVEESY